MGSREGRVESAPFARSFPENLVCLPIPQTYCYRRLSPITHGMVENPGIGVNMCGSMFKRL